MVDNRKIVEKDRGLIKKMELAIPGFRGYRKKEDIRIADTLLRTQLADKLRNVAHQAERAQKKLVANKELDLIEDVGTLITIVKTTENRVRHAEQGYSGISADYRIEEDELNKLYEWDLSLLDFINRIRTEVVAFTVAAKSSDKKTIEMELESVRAEVEEFNMIFEERMTLLAATGGK